MSMFNVMVYLKDNPTKEFTIKDIAEALNMSYGGAAKDLKRLTDFGFVSCELKFPKTKDWNFNPRRKCFYRWKGENDEL